MSTTRERDIERYFNKQVLRMRGLSIKWVSPGMAGVPDRIAFIPWRIIRLVELKSPTGSPSKLQLAVFKLLEIIGFPVDILSTEEEIDEWVLKVKQEQK